MSEAQSIRSRLVLTLFTVPKPFSDEHVARIQKNALRSWKSLRPKVEVIVFGDEAGIDGTCRDLDLQHVAQVERNEHGTPLLNDIFKNASGRCSTPLLGYVNTDIILMNDLVQTSLRAMKVFPSFLLIGQRWDWKLRESISFREDWEEELKARVLGEGRLHPPQGSDYFIFPTGSFRDMPPFAVGRSGWDNWMIFKARQLRYAVMDATGAITAIHQDHDYHHLPGGQPHYRLPESRLNVDLAGGPTAMFTLRDATWHFVGREPEKLPLFHQGFVRWLETSFTLHFGPGRISRWFSLFLHPGRLLAYLLSRARS